MTLWDKPMLRTRTTSMHRFASIMLIALCGIGFRCLDAAAADSSPAAPTIPDAHQYFETLVSNNGVTAIYETRSRNGDILGYESFPVHEYKGIACNSVISLKNGVKIDIDWRVV
ncbi:hypothetical protein JZU51_00180, partial [bacterium]|nr:hypothetical protein [bacterium]